MNMYFYGFALSILFTSKLFTADQPVLTQETETKQLIAKGKLLKSPQMRLLNMVLEQSPNAVVRTKITCAKCAKAIQAINELQQAQVDKITTVKKYFENEEQERVFITGHLKLIIDPVKTFFDVVHAHKSLVAPIVAESLGITEKDFAKSLLLRFFITNEEVSTFFDRDIKTIDDLKNASLELITVFNDLNENLSERARKNCEEIIRKMQEAQKQTAQKVR